MLNLFKAVPLWVKLVTVLALASAIFWSGWSVRDAFCDAAFEKARADQLARQVAILESSNAIADAAATADAADAAANAKTLDDLNEKLRSLTDALDRPSDDCLDAPAADRLRELWKP